MKPIALSVFILIASKISAGTLIPITDDIGLSSGLSGSALESDVNVTGLGSDTEAISLQGHAPANPLAGQNTDSGMSGQGQGVGFTGFVAAPLPEQVVPRPLEPVLPTPPEPVRFELRDLHFGYDSADLALSEKPVIAELAAVIVHTRPKSITLIGHTDRQGNREYNLELSERRALAVLNALVEWHGFDPALFQVLGKGEEELVSAGLTEADHALDRRVEVVLDGRN